jgi:hypothetical protein
MLLDSSIHMFCIKYRNQVNRIIIIMQPRQLPLMPNSSIINSSTDSPRRSNMVNMDTMVHLRVVVERNRTRLPTAQTRPMESLEIAPRLLHK